MVLHLSLRRQRPLNKHTVGILWFVTLWTQKIILNNTIVVCLSPLVVLLCCKACFSTECEFAGVVRIGCIPAHDDRFLVANLVLFSCLNLRGSFAGENDRTANAFGGPKWVFA